MADPATIEPTPIDIGMVAQADFARAPDPKTLFAARAARFAQLAPGHALESYLVFLGALSGAQHDVQDGLTEPALPAPETMERAFAFGMPPLDRARFDAAFDGRFAA